MTRTGLSERRLRSAMGALLRAGVLAAAAVVAVGGAALLFQSGREAVRLGSFRGEPDDLRAVAGIVRSALALRSQGVIQLGLLLLVATPVARVVFALAGFALERDWLYAGVSGLVLALLLCSLLWVGVPR